MNAAAYRKLIWGFLFTVLHFRINGFDLLPDVVGFLLISAGLSRLSRLHTHFLYAHRLVFLLLLFSLFTLWDGNDMNSAPYLFDPAHLTRMLIGQAYMLLSLLLMYLINQAMISLALLGNQNQLAKSGRERWAILLYTSLASLYTYPFLLHIEKEWIYLFAFLGVVSFLAQLAWIFYLSRFRKEYEGMQSPGWE